MTDAPDELTLARDMIEVHGMQAATVVRGNARAAVAARRADPAGKVVDKGARRQPTAARQ